MAEIVQEVEISAAPEPHGFMPRQPAIDAPGNRVRTRLKASPKEEYVSGSSLNSSSLFAETLPQYIDPVSNEFGNDLYERMATDAHVYGEVTTLIESAISNGVRLTGAVEKEEGKHEGGYGYNRSEKIRQFCEDNFACLPMHDFLFDMGRCCYLGHRVAEVVYREEAGQLYIDRLKIKERNAFAFVVDNRKNVVGIVANIAGRYSAMVTPTTAVSIEQTPNLLPVDKFAIATHRPFASDPRGTSLFRAAYNIWWLKSRALEHYHAYLSNYANPAVYGTTAENQGDEEDEDGATITAEQAMANSLATIRNGWTGAFPNGATVSTVIPPGQSGDGAPFLKAFDYYDKQLSKAILSNPLATNEGRHQARAAANEGKDVFDIIVEGLEECLEQMLHRLLYNLVEINFGEADAKKYTPKPELGAAEEADFKEQADGFVALKGAGIIQNAHLEFIWAKLGLPKVEMDAEPMQLDKEGKPVPMIVPGANPDPDPETE